MATINEPYAMSLADMRGSRSYKSSRATCAPDYSVLPLIGATARSASSSLRLMAAPFPGNRERRAVLRYALQLPVIVLDSENHSEIHAVTRDVSSKGIFFWAGSWSVRAAEIQFKMIFPAQITGTEGMRATCRGRTVRIETNSSAGRTGIAATIDSIALVH